MSFILKLKTIPKVLIDARCISPDRFAGKKLDEVRGLRLLEGGVTTTLDTIFDVDGPSTALQNAKDVEIIIEGSSDKLCYIGYKMSNGRITIKGSVGHFIGYKMRNGLIVVYGNTRNYLGAKMVGGVIEVFGNVGHRVGSKLQGEKAGKGMKEGTIYIHGTAGSDIGWDASGGTIIVEGGAGDFVGADMTGGTIVIKGNAGIYPGYNMSSGRAVIGGRVGSLLPSFYIDSIAPSIKVKGISFQKPFATLIGDAIVLGRGILQISYEDNVHILEQYKQLLEEVPL